MVLQDSVSVRLCHKHCDKALPCSLTWRHHRFSNSTSRILFKNTNLPKTGAIPVSLSLSLSLLAGTNQTKPQDLCGATPSLFCLAATSSLFFLAATSPPSWGLCCREQPRAATPSAPVPTPTRSCGSCHGCGGSHLQVTLFSSGFESR